MLPFDHKQASKTIHLTHVPKKGEREESLSHCHVCMEEKALTKEHIPPEKAFNNCNRLWDRIVLTQSKITKRRAQIRGGLWVKTLCGHCNNNVCSPYAKEYVNLVKQLVEKPKLFDVSGDARIFSVQINPLFVAKEIATMILAVEQLQYAKHVPILRKFVQDKNKKIVPPFKIYAFLVPDVEQAGTVLRFHGRVDTYAPGYEFVGGEISWYPFGFVYAYKIGKGYNIEKLTDITNWFSGDFSKDHSSILLKLHCRITGVDSIQSLLTGNRTRPQIDYISERYS